jgi:hypothetical protein
MGRLPAPPRLQAGGGHRGRGGERWWVMLRGALLHGVGLLHTVCRDA